MYKKLFAVGALSMFLWTGNALAAMNFYIAPGLTYNDMNGLQGSPGGITFQGLTPRFAGGVTGWNLGGIFLGGEVFAEPFKSLIINDDADGEGRSMKVGSNYGISFMPGYSFDDVISLIARIGVVRTNFENLGTTSTGYQLGVSLEAALFGPWLGRIEYIRTGYYHIDGVSQIHNDSGTASLVYRFGYDNRKGLLCF